MTNAIEQSKREMYARLADLKQFVRASQFNMKEFEESMEKHLELLRQDHEALHETARKRFEDIQGLEAMNVDLTERLSLMTTDRDSLRNRMQAYEALESQASTSGQTSVDRASCATLDAKTAAILGAAVDIRKISDAWAMTGRRAKKSMLKISGMLARPEVYAALEEIGKSDSYAAWFLNNTQCMHSFPSGEQCVFCGVGK